MFLDLLFKTIIHMFKKTFQDDLAPQWACRCFRVDSSAENL